jgi:hypothetical protein
MIEFRARELKKGASRTVTVGALEYTATILKARHRKKDRKQYYMGSVAVRVDVRLVGSQASTSTSPSGQGHRPAETRDESPTATSPSGQSGPDTDTRDADPSALSFYFPGDGRRNNNKKIGDFCCTGETATVSNENGNAIGYIYFHDFKGGKFVSLTKSGASKLIIHVSGASDWSNPGSRRQKRSITFSAGELTKGMSRSVRVGALNYTATILKAKLAKNRTLYVMGSVKVRVDVGR